MSMEEELTAAIADESADEGGAVQPPAPGSAFNLVEDVIYRRRSVRFYRKQQVPEHLVRRIIEAGRFAPSAGNCQPRKFIVIQDQKMIGEMTQEIVTFCQRIMWMLNYIDGAPWKKPLAQLFQRLRPNDLHPIPFGAMKLIAEGKLKIWHGAPTVIAIFADMRCAGSPVLDVGIAGQNMVLAANSFGLGTCWVSFIKPLAYLPKWRKRLGIRHPYKLLTSIAVGYTRGAPDGQVARETQAIDWFTETGAFKVVY
jgi:nitroreductase